MLNKNINFMMTMLHSKVKVFLKQWNHSYLINCNALKNIIQTFVGEKSFYMIYKCLKK